MNDTDVGHAKWMTQAIEIDPNIPHYRCKPFKRNKENRIFLDNYCMEMLEKGIIRKSNSTIASPVVVVNKPGNKPRITIDYRRINKYIKRG